jgi:hypothetical protein
MITLNGLHVFVRVAASIHGICRAPRGIADGHENLDHAQVMGGNVEWVTGLRNLSEAQV